jgi:hypothetical protein
MGKSKSSNSFFIPEITITAQFTLARVCHFKMALAGENVCPKLKWLLAINAAGTLTINVFSTN